MAMIILLIAGLIKKRLYKMSQYFPKPYEPFGSDINVKVLIMQQKQISKISRTLILQVLH